MQRYEETVKVAVCTPCATTSSCQLRILAEACESIRRWPLEKPFLLEAYTFGDVLRGADPLDCVPGSAQLGRRKFFGGASDETAR